MNANTATNPIVPPIPETPVGTAARLRRRLRDLYPATTFRVQVRPLAAGGAGRELVVSWAGGPTLPEVLAHTEPFARRTARGHDVDATLWADQDGGLSLPYPGAERIRLQHDPAGTE